jgi:hypothetical protein
MTDPLLRSRFGPRAARRRAAPWRRRLVPVLACAAATAAFSRSADAQTFAFDTSTQGWLVYSIAAGGQFIQNPVAQATPVFDAALGLPPGSLRVGDQAGETWIGSPGSVNGDRSSLYGGEISYDILYRFADNAVYAGVALAGPDFTLIIGLPPPVLNEWAHKSFPLLPGDWRLNSTSGPVATEAQIREVLADFRGMYVHTEWRTGPDDTSVDNIRLGSCPGDVDGDGFIGFADLNAVVSAFNTSSGEPAYNGAADFDGDGDVDFADLNVVLSAFNTDC